MAIACQRIQIIIFKIGKEMCQNKVLLLTMYQSVTGEHLLQILVMYVPDIHHSDGTKIVSHLSTVVNIKTVAH